MYDAELNNPYKNEKYLIFFDKTFIFLNTVSSYVYKHSFFLLPSE